mmetsp:Transcript_137226/g.342107  ORF Transcript_137226/g.342107 Transcript_137226/m.342107 type:complete len:203 (+) Transcript_137226:733-1341(+)
MDSVSSPISLASSESCCDIPAIDAAPSSILAINSSTCACNFVRVCLLVPSSVSHHPLCSDSSPASRSNFVIKSWMRPFTFVNGSADDETCCASRPSLELCSRWPAWLRKATRVWRSSTGASPEDSAGPELCERRCAREAAEAAEAAGRCSCAEPRTSGERRISMAFSMALISSARRPCFSWKDFAFSMHSTFKPCKYATSSL